MNLSCTTSKYDLLYAPCLRNPGGLLDAVEYRPGEMVLDFCGGTGAVALECLRRGADPWTVHLFDLNPRCPDPRIHTYRGDAERLGHALLHDSSYGRYDLIVCRQAAAYLSLSAPQILWLQSMLRSGGRLVFNLFTRPPLLRFRSQEYEGRQYLEAGCRFGRRILHLQVCPSVGFDVSYFYWHDQAQLRERLSGVFNVRVKMRGKSQTWICERKGF